MFLLKQYDKPLLTFDIADDPLDGQKCHIKTAEEKTAVSFLSAWN